MSLKGPGLCKDCWTFWSQMKKKQSRWENALYSILYRCWTQMEWYKGIIGALIWELIWIGDGYILLEHCIQKYMLLNRWWRLYRKTEKSRFSVISMDISELKKPSCTVVLYSLIQSCMIQGQRMPTLEFCLYFYLRGTLNFLLRNAPSEWKNSKNPQQE